MEKQKVNQVFLRDLPCQVSLRVDRLQSSLNCSWVEVLKALVREKTADKVACMRSPEWLDGSFGLVNHA